MHVFRFFQARTAPVTFTPEYDDPQLPGAYLALASATSGATIYYTTDGTTDPVNTVAEMS